MAELTNWAGNHRWTPQAIVEPHDEAEVVGVVRRAAAERQRLKVVGGGHSWSGAATTNGHAIRLDHLNRVIDIGGGIVTVEAGIRLGQLVARLDEVGLALAILPTITEQTAAGAIATATHGSSLDHGSLSSLVRGLRLVTAAGEVLDLDEADNRLDAARVHLGGLGVVTQIELAVETQFWLRETVTPLTVEDLAEALPEVAASAEYVKVWWFPHSRRCAVFRMERTTDRGEVSDAAQKMEHGLNRFVFPGLLQAGRRWPALIPRISRLVGATFARPHKRVGRSQDVLTAAMPPINRQIEYALPFERAPEAFSALARLIRDKKLLVDFPAEIRFSAADTAWMSPAHGGPTVHIGAYIAQSSDLESYFTGFERAMLDLGGRPHPGKEHGRVPADFLALFADGPRFRDLAFELDPDGMFANPFLDRWLGRRP